MKIDKPTKAQIQPLLQLWKTVFGEYNGYWELFLNTGFSPERCRCITEGERVLASLCWLDCDVNNQKQAYLYAVLTHPDHRGKGLCRMLLADTHSHLKDLGYTAALLVPENDALRRMYEKLDYKTATWISECSCPAGTKKLPLRAIGAAEYGSLRRKYLSPDGAIQEGPSLALLAAQVQFYTSETSLLAAYEEGGILHGLELLGDIQAAPGIVAALDCSQGAFRVPGQEKPFAMFHPLAETAKKPDYFGFAFD